MSRLLISLILVVSFLFVAPAPAHAQDTGVIEKTFCLSATGFPDLAALKDALLADVKRQAVSEFFGELISASTAVENFVVTSDQIQASSLGFVRIFGDPHYFNGANLAETCVTIQAYVTEADRAQFEPVVVTKRLCLANSDLAAEALASLVKKEVVIQALYDYDPDLQAADRAYLPSLMQRITFSESGFLQDTATYCVAMEGFVTPVEVLAFNTLGGAVDGAVSASAGAPAPANTASAPAAAAPAAAAPAAAVSASSGKALGAAVEIAAVESAHPYANDSAESWFISNDSALEAMQLHFSRIELEEGVDRIRITDADGRLMQEITTSYPDGLWSELVPGVGAYVWLETDSADTAWGLAVDAVAPVTYKTIGYSAHPYGPNLQDEVTFFNDAVDPAGTKLTFDRIDLEENVDWLIVHDINGNPYQYITGSYPQGFTSVAVPGPAIKIILVTDGSGAKWGYNAVNVATAAADVPVEFPEFGTLIETAHPYDRDYSNEWTITNPDPAAKSTKVHFKQVELGDYSSIEISDANNTIVQTIYNNSSFPNGWSDSVPGRVVKVKFTSGRSAWGFRIDRLANSIPNPGLAQSSHPYPRDISSEWTLTNSDTKAKSTKVHFDWLQLGDYTSLQLLDASNTIIQQFESNMDGGDFWSDFVPGRVVKVRLTAGRSDWGFRIDQVASSVEYPGLAQSSHPYPRDEISEWTITNADATATSTRVHFTRLQLGDYTQVELMDVTDNIVQTLTRSSNGTDFWSDYIPSRVVKVRLTAGRSDWGFRIDMIESK